MIILELRTFLYYQSKLKLVKKFEKILNVMMTLFKRRKLSFLKTIRGFV